VHVWTPGKLTADQERVFRDLAEIEGAPPSEDGLKKLWKQLREALGA
jgi:hypothetical protein